MNHLLWRIYRSLVRFKQLITRTLKRQGLLMVKSVLHITHKLTEVFVPLLATVLLMLAVYDAGFNDFQSHSRFLYVWIVSILLALKFFYLLRFISEWTVPKKISAHLFSFVLVVAAFVLHHVSKIVAADEQMQTNNFLLNKLAMFALVVFLFLTELANVLRFIYIRRLNPAFLFMLSFLFIILLGTLLLLLPNATTKHIHFIDALFTATSAVCVTGLTVLDTANDFTPAGRVIILLLIQIGGLGIMTFTGLLAYLATGTSSFQSQLALKDMINSNRIGNVITMVKRIVYITFIFEAIGAVFVYFSVEPQVFASSVERVFFAVFHSISAFCNAGFSTYSAGLNDPILKFNYNLHILLGLLILLGGMGFPIVFNFFSWIHVKFTNVINRLLKNELHLSTVRVIQVNSKLALVTTFVLLFFGAVSYFLFEQEATLLQHPTMWGKIVTAFFGSVTPRTAGFNSVDMTTFTMPTIMLYLLLMWIGASPGSTGGGIKTTTFAVAVLNLLAIARGKERTEVYHTQISEASINKAFATMMLSLLIIGLAVLLMSVYDAEYGIMRLAFEAFSAFSTVGLTLGITPSLSEVSKIVLIIVMFVGRVGALTFLMAFVVKVKNTNYRYPQEEIMY